MRPILGPAVLSCGVPPRTAGGRKSGAEFSTLYFRRIDAIRLFASLTGFAILAFARFITAVRGIWAGSDPVPRRRVYFANHRSHGDFVLIWTVLPPDLRARVRPVAGAEYWEASKFRRFIGTSVFNAVLIARDAAGRRADPVAQMAAALDQGESLILFPEGTRNMGDAPLLPFKSGLYHLATQQPEVDLVPVWIENLNRVLPKGRMVPVPLICTVTFGAALRLAAGEEKTAFLTRAEAALLALSPNAPNTPSKVQTPEGEA